MHSSQFSGVRTPPALSLPLEMVWITPKMHAEPCYELTPKVHGCGDRCLLGDSLSANSSALMRGGIRYTKIRSQNDRVILVGKELQDPRVQPQPTPLCPLLTSLSATSPQLLNTSRDSDCTTSVGSPCHCITALPKKKHFLIFNLNIPWQNIRPFPLGLLLSPGRSVQPPPHHSHLSGSCREP